MAKSILFAGLEPEHEKELRGDFKSSLLIRRRLQEVLRMKLDAAHKELRSKTNYEDASWAFKMADNVGYERAVHELISLLEDSEK